MTSHEYTKGDQWRHVCTVCVFQVHCGHMCTMYIIWKLEQWHRVYVLHSEFGSLMSYTHLHIQWWRRVYNVMVDRSRHVCTLPMMKMDRQHFTRIHWLLRADPWNHVCTLCILKLVLWRHMHTVCCERSVDLHKETDGYDSTHRSPIIDSIKRWCDEGSCRHSNGRLMTWGSQDSFNKIF